MAKNQTNEVPAVKTIESVDLTGLNISGKIRRLNAEGFSNGQIAKFLDKRYQHVRNVLITPVKNPVGATPAATVEAA
jgi:hypothetical protein